MTEEAKPVDAAMARLRRVARVNEALGVLRDAGTDEETMAAVESGIQTHDMFQHLMGMINMWADPAQPGNYVALKMVGMMAPFDRAAIELIRPGHMDSAELCEQLKTQLRRAIALLDSYTSGGTPYEATVEYVATMKKMLGDMLGGPDAPGAWRARKTADEVAEEAKVP